MNEADLPVFDATKFYLGSVCKRGHNWHNTGKSLRYKSTCTCIECKRIHESTPLSKEERRRYREENREKLRQASYDRYWSNPERFRAEMAQYRQENAELCRQQRQGRYLKNREKFIDAVKQNYQKNRIKILERSKLNYLTNPDIKRKKLAYNRKRKALKKGNHHVKINQVQLDQRLNAFNGCCSYCGEPNSRMTIDHFIAVSKGGPDCLGNYVPACEPCNISKKDRDPKIWFESQSFYSKARWLEILRLLGKAESDYNQIPLF